MSKLGKRITIKEALDRCDQNLSKTDAERRESRQREWDEMFPEEQEYVWVVWGVDGKDLIQINGLIPFGKQNKKQKIG